MVVKSRSGVVNLVSVFVNFLDVYTDTGDIKLMVGFFGMKPPKTGNPPPYPAPGCRLATNGGDISALAVGGTPDMSFSADAVDFTTKLNLNMRTDTGQIRVRATGAL